jgi:four helix bundle protein
LPSELFGYADRCRTIARAGGLAIRSFARGHRSRSKAEFIAKLGTVLEEADETLYWLELMVETEMVKSSRLKLLIKECDELVSIFVASLNTAKG